MQQRRLSHADEAAEGALVQRCTCQPQFFVQHMPMSGVELFEDRKDIALLIEGDLPALGHNLPH